MCYSAPPKMWVHGLVSPLISVRRIMFVKALCGNRLLRLDGFIPRLLRYIRTILKQIPTSTTWGPRRPPTPYFRENVLKQRVVKDTFDHLPYGSWGALRNHVAITDINIVFCSKGGTASGTCCMVLVTLKSHIFTIRHTISNLY